MGATIPAAVAEALTTVFDPCSMATGHPLNVVEMGLVRDVSIDEGRVSITLCATTPSCVLIASIMEGVHDAVAARAGVDHVEVTLDAEVFWTPDLMSGEARAQQERRRTELTRRMKERRQLAIG